MIPGFGLLHLRRLWDRPGRVVMAVLGIVAGSALVVTMLGVYGSITTSVERLSDLAGPADLELTPAADTGFDHDRITSIVDPDEVDSLAPLVRTPVAINGDVILLFGADARAAGFGDALATELGPALASGGTDGLILTASTAEELGLAEGDELEVFSNTGGTQRSQVAGILTSPVLESVNGGKLAFGALVTTQDLLGRDTLVDAVLVDALPGEDPSQLGSELRDRLGPSVLVEDRSTREERIAAPAITYLSQVGPVAGMALVVGGFLVFNTMNMAALERRRELATLRALGASRRRLVGGLVGEAAVLGLIGSVGGVLVGIFLARAVVGELPAAMEQAVGVDVSFALPTPMLGIALVLGLAASTGAALVPALRATRAHPVDALRPDGTLAGGGEPSAISWWPFTAGTVLLTVGYTVLVTVRDDRATAGILLLALGGVAASYGLAGPISRLAAKITRMGGGLGHLAASGLERSPHRVWATSMAIALAVAMTLAVASGARNQLDVDAEHLASLRDSDLVVASRPLDELAIDVYLPEDVPQRLAGIDGVTGTSTLTTQKAVLDGRGFLVYGADAPPGDSAFPLLELVTAENQAATLAGDATIVSHQFARAFDLEEGDTLQIPGNRETVELPVAEVVSTLSVSDNGMIVVADHHLRRAFGTDGYSSIDVLLADDADRTAIRREIESFAATQPYPLVVGTGEESYQAIIGGIVAAQQLMYAILVVTAGVAAIAVLNTLAASILDRWRELGVLRAVGTTPRQLARIIGLEAAGVGAVGVSAGLVIGEIIHWGGVRYIGNASPLPAEFAFVPELIVVAALAGVAATILGALIPIRRATRVDVLDAIAWE